MKRLRGIHDLRAEFDGIKGVCAGDTKFIAHAMMFMCERLARKEQKRKPTEWQKFMGKEMRKGKSLQEAAAEWQRRKVLKAG